MSRPCSLETALPWIQILHCDSALVKDSDPLKRKGTHHFFPPRLGGARNVAVAARLAYERREECTPSYSLCFNHSSLHFIHQRWRLLA